MNRAAVAFLVAAVGSCFSEGKREGSPKPASWCYGCDGTTLYAPNAEFLIMTAWDSACTGGTMRADTQVHPCDSQEHVDSLTCVREGGGGECTVVVKDHESLVATPKTPGIYLIAVTMKPARGGKPYHQELGRVVIDVPDQYKVSCGRPKIQDTVDVRVEALKGTVPVLGPLPVVKVAGGAAAGVACEQFSMPGDDYQAIYDFGCTSAEAETSVEVAISTPSLSATMHADCPIEPMH